MWFKGETAQTIIMEFSSGDVQVEMTWIETKPEAAGTKQGKLSLSTPTKSRSPSLTIFGVLVSELVARKSYRRDTFTCTQEKDWHLVVEMADCVVEEKSGKSGIPDLPASVNASLFSSLIQQGRILEAIMLLPAELQLSLLSNSSTSPSSMNTSTTNCSFIRDLSPLFSKDMVLIKVYAWILLLTSITGIMGNALVLAVYLRKRKELTPYKWLIVHLAMCDFTFATLQVFLAIPPISTTKWQFGNYGCKILQCASQLGGLVAIGVLLLIAIERYIAILVPLKRDGSGKRTVVGITLVWALSVASVIPAGTAMIYDPSKKVCIEKWDHAGLTKTAGFVYDYYLLFAFFVIPLGVIGFSYVKMMRFLWRSSSERGMLYSNANVEAVDKRRREDKRAIRLLLVVVFVFSLCVLPGKVLWIVMRHIDVERLPFASYYTLMYTGLLPYPLHITVNPIIYSLVDARFRRNARGIFTHALNKLCMKLHQNKDEAFVLNYRKKKTSSQSSSYPDSKCVSHILPVEVIG